MATAQINGIGVRDFHRTLSSGSFNCANEACKSRRRGEQTQTYKLITGRPWFTFLWVPLIPIGSRFLYVECKSCKAAYNPSVIDSEGS